MCQLCVVNIKRKRVLKRFDVIFLIPRSQNQHYSVIRQYDGSSRRYADDYGKPAGKILGPGCTITGCTLEPLLTKPLVFTPPDVNPALFINTLGVPVLTLLVLAGVVRWAAGVTEESCLAVWLRVVESAEDAFCANEKETAPNCKKENKMIALVFIKQVLTLIIH